MQHAISPLWGYCCRECEEAMEIRSIMKAGVELALSRCFHTTAVEDFFFFFFQNNRLSSL